MGLQAVIGMWSKKNGTGGVRDPHFPLGNTLVTSFTAFANADATSSMASAMSPGDKLSFVLPKTLPTVSAKETAATLKISEITFFMRHLPPVSPLTKKRNRRKI